MHARISTATALWAASAIALASANGCAVANRNGELSANGRIWSRIGRLSDRLAITQPFLDEDAYLDPSFAGDPAATCPRPDTVGSISNLPEPSHE